MYRDFINAFLAAKRNGRTERITFMQRGLDAIDFAMWLHDSFCIPFGWKFNNVQFDSDGRTVTVIGLERVRLAA